MSGFQLAQVNIASGHVAVMRRRREWFEGIETHCGRRAEAGVDDDRWLCPA